jgi:hypothetical protein
VGVSVDQLAVALDSLSPATLRREPRVDTVRIVEYAPFPRVGAQQGPRIGFTRDISRSGMCIGTDEAEPVGALLRVSVRELDGRSSPPCIERVVWCSRTPEGRHWIGLERLTETESR